jgi:RHS repeat-associated protein
MRASLDQRSGDQTVRLYGPDGYSVLSETRQFLVGAMPTQSSSEHIWLPTASGPMSLVVVMDGQPLAVHADHLNTPRRLTDAAGRVRWQWAYSAFGEIPPQALAHAGQPLLDAYSLRYPGQVDDGNGLFYNFNRFYDARSGRYTQADPIGLEGGWNRFGYVGGDPLGFVDPHGHSRRSPQTRPPRNQRGETWREQVERVSREIQIRRMEEHFNQQRLVRELTRQSSSDLHRVLDWFVPPDPTRTLVCQFAPNNPECMDLPPRNPGNESVCKPPRF